MTILHVQFPNWPGWNMPECSLTSLDELQSKHPLAKDITVSVDPSFNTDYYCDSPVFRAFIVEPPVKSKKATVALKFAMRDDLIADLVEEADTYTGALRPVQGSAVPRCYGLYVGEGDEGQTIACLVLEYWGESLRQRFGKLSMNTKMQILNRLGEIHKQGLSLGDFAERNILEKNGDIRLIDFDMTTQHKCKCKMNFRPGDKVPDEKEFGCEQLWEICRYDLKIWAN